MSDEIDALLDDEPLDEKVESEPPSDEEEPSGPLSDPYVLQHAEFLKAQATEKQVDALARMLAADESDRRGEDKKKRAEREERALRYHRFRLAMARGDEPLRPQVVTTKDPDGWDG